MPPIDWSAIWGAINPTSLGLLCALAFIASLIGQSLVGRNPFVGAIVATIIFAAIYVFWNGYGQQFIPAIPRFPA
jgi:hypothetical protein